MKLLFIGLILEVLILGGLILLQLESIKDDIVAAIKSLRDGESFTEVLKRPLRPDSRDGLTVEDLVAARRVYGHSKPDPLPPLAEQVPGIKDTSGGN